MSKIEFYNNVKSIVDTAIEDIKVFNAEASSIENKINSKRYNIDVVNKELVPHLNDTKKAIRARQDIANAVIEDVVNNYIDKLISEDRLKGEELTADIKLLETGIVLSAKDVEMIFDRNIDNNTMKKLIVEYAKQHNIKINRHYQPKNADLIESVKGVPYIANMVIKWHNKPEIYKELISENSKLYKMFSEE